MFPGFGRRVDRDSNGSYPHDVKENLKDLKNTAENLGRKDENVVKIVLFGSLAEGKAVRSDADILVLLSLKGLSEQNI